MIVKYCFTLILCAVFPLAVGCVPRASTTQHETAAHEHGPDCDHDHEGHDHAHDDMASVEISEEGQDNIGLRTVQTALSDFQRTVRIPGRVVGRPEHWLMAVAAPVDGVITDIGVTVGESVEPGKSLFKLRVTGEDLIDRQTNLLEQVEQLVVVRQEEDRLRGVVDSGAAAGKSLLERQYERQRLEAAIRAAREGLELVGFGDEQIGTIIKDRKLVGKLTVMAPGHHEDECCEEVHTLTVAKLNVVTGQRVATGESLATLGDYCKLQIEAYAAESDAPYLNHVLSDNLPVAAVVSPAGIGTKERQIAGLKLLYIDPELDSQTRSVRFVVDLDNEAVHESELEGRRFTTWRYRPGERAEILLPLEVWTDRIVLPAEAVVQDGAESVVFIKDGNLFLRHPVVEEFRDTNRVVLKEGSLDEGVFVVTRGAFRVHLTMQNASGGAIDPHAGHSH